jgi:poly(beta-D-mannuronate) lyase
MSINKLLFTLVLVVVNLLACAQVVTNSTELNNAIAAAVPGTTITLADGIWNNVFIDIDKNGTSMEPITITAQNPEAVLMTGNSRVYMRGSFLTVSGLIFKNSANLVINGSSIEPIFELNQCDYCKVINNKIDSYNGTETQKTMKFKWVYITDGQYNEIAYNSFIGKYGVGSIINDNRSQSNADYLKIHHNYFADRTPINGINDDNDQDAIRIGTSATSLSNSFSEVYANYFYNFFGEIEVISNKSGENKYYYNTFRDYGGCLTLRHGDNCEVFGNYFFAENNFLTGGVRVIGEGHKVYNNYIEGTNFRKPSGSSSSLTGGINVMNGLLNSPLNGYYQVKNAQIVNNTFVNCDYALRIGTDKSGNNTQEPENLTVANNIMYNSSIDAYQIVTSPSGNSTSQGNLTSLATSDMVDDGNFHRLTNGSTPIDAGLGSYSFLTQDILKANRNVNFDAGAEEFGANGTFLPFDSTDVGVNVGFGANQNTTSTNNMLRNQGIKIFPVPVTDGKLTISSIFKPLSNIEIYDVSGKQTMTIQGNGKNLKEIDVTHLSSGIYFIKIKDIGQAKFIIK